MRILRLALFFALPLSATVNEALRWECLSCYRNDRIHWNLQTGGTGLLNYRELYRDLQFWENGLSLKTIHRDIVFMVRGSYAAFGKGNAYQLYPNPTFATDHPHFTFHAAGWAADTSGYLGYAVNLTAGRTYSVVLIPLFGYSAHFEQLKRNEGKPDPWVSSNAVGASSYTMQSMLSEPFHLTWYGVFIGSGFQVEPGGRLVFSGGYSYHWLTANVRTHYENTIALFNPGLVSEQTHIYSLHAKAKGNLGQTGWAEIDALISRFWRAGFGIQVHYYSTTLIQTTLREQVLPLLPSAAPLSQDILQKLKIRWTSISGWFMVSRKF